MRGFFRKATREDGMQQVLERVNFKQKFSSLPQFNPGVSPSSMPSLPASPQVSWSQNQPGLMGTSFLAWRLQLIFKLIGMEGMKTSECSVYLD